MVPTWLAGAWAQFTQRKLTFQVHCCIWREVFCICFDVDFCLHPQAAILLRIPPNAEGKEPATGNSMGNSLPRLSKKLCSVSSSERMTVDATHGTFKLEDWIAWRIQTFKESLSSLKLENILGLDKKRGNNLYLVYHAFLWQKIWANNYLTW